MADFIKEPEGRARVAARAGVVVVGGGPAGISAAVAAARSGLSVILVERYAYLGGLASGGMVLVLDDMCYRGEITVRGICAEMIERMQKMGLCALPPEGERISDAALWRKWNRWGVIDYHSLHQPKEVAYAAAFDPDGYKRAANEMTSEAKVQLRLHSWFSRAIVEDGKIKGVICETKAGREALLADVVIDTSGDLDVAASAGAPFAHESYLVTTVFRLGGVEVEAAERFEYERPAEFSAVDREAMRILRGSWSQWWLKTPLPGIVWCNCPHLTGLDGIRVEDLTRAERQGRERIEELIAFVKERMPGFEKAFLIDVAPQLGVRQTRLLEGAYIVTKEDIQQRRRFPDSVARGRDYFTPYRALLPRGVSQLLVAGRHYSATAMAQRISREIPPCMAMGEAAGVAAAVALEDGVTVDRVDVPRVQARLRAQGADPGDGDVQIHEPGIG